MTRTETPNTILLVDDHRLVRQGVRLLIQHESALQLVGEAGDAKNALALVRDLQPDIALIDLGLPDLDGVEVIRRLPAIAPATRAIALTASLDRRDMDRALAAGARAYVVKHGGGDELIATIKAVLADLSGIRPALIENQAPPSPDPPPGPPLTDREREIAGLIAGGSHNSEIAEALDISVFTVRKHRQNLMAKLALRNAAEIASFAIRHGLFKPRA
jgi:DNA-binding NarL/FixJ family response regulator